MCRTYGAGVFATVDPALSGWANFLRAYGAELIFDGIFEFAYVEHHASPGTPCWRASITPFAPARLSHSSDGRLVQHCRVLRILSASCRISCCFQAGRPPMSRLEWARQDDVTGHAVGPGLGTQLKESVVCKFENCW